MQHCLAGGEACCLDVFFPYLADLQVDRSRMLGTPWLITARSKATSAALKPSNVRCSAAQTLTSCLFSELRDNVAVQEFAKPQRRNTRTPGNCSWEAHKCLTAARALLKADMWC